MRTDGALARLAALPPSRRAEVVASLPDEVILALRWDWPGEFARPDQLAPGGDWRTWLILAGRGWGKTRTGAEWIREVAKTSGVRIALVARTAADARDVMVEGESGILAVCPPWDRPVYEPSKRLVRWRNGAEAHLYSAEEPSLLRGPQHHAAWADELAAWRRDRETWDMLSFGLRLGDNPRAIVTTTPRPTKLIRELAEGGAVTRGSSYDNRANLPGAFLEALRSRYEGTRLARQEIHAEILDDVLGAIVSHEMIDDARVDKAPDLTRIVVGVDPALTSHAESDETGIAVVGLGVDGDIYVLDDRTCRLSPQGWAERAVSAYDAHEASRIIAEKNAGGDMVEATIRQVRRDVPVKTVTASRGKHVRFEPVGALYEQGRVHHIGSLPDLEEQVCAFTPGGYDGDGSPDRADAMVWGVTELLDNRRVGYLGGIEL